MAKEEQDKREGLFTGQDADGNDVTVYVKKPTVKEYRDSQISYNKAFRSALDSGAVLKKKLNEYMRDQGLWDDEKESEEQKLVDQMMSLEKVLKSGGIPLKDARKTALDLRKVRGRFRSLVAERTVLDANTVEGQADNARFNALVSLCILKENQSGPFFATQEDYDKRAGEPFAAEAASKLAGLIYELDPNYDDTLEENKFLSTYNFANENYELINADGHRIALDEDGVTERLINEDGRYIAYKTDEGYKNQDPEQAYFVNIDGEEVDEEGTVAGAFSPFLDDSGKPVDVPSKEEASEEEVEEVAEKPKKRGRPKKTEEIT